MSAIIAFLSGVQWGAIGAGLYFVNAQIISPCMAPPAPESRFLYRVTYRASSVAAGNYGQARNASDPKVNP